MSIDQLYFTDCPRGKGLTPSATGYQIKACSAGLTTDDQRLLAGVCMHYGNAVYAHAPRAALDAETAWRKQTVDLNSMPSLVLDEFPIIWSYDHLSNGRCALTRVCYLGITTDKRFGNFFAHTLVFMPESLASNGSNPLRLGQMQRLFQGCSNEDNTALPVLTSFGSTVPDKADYHFLRNNDQHLSNLISALSAASLPNARPVLVCLPDWRSSAGVVEALLNSLPPSARVRTTFCTYETERKKLGPADGSRPSSVVGLHHLIVQCNAEGQTFGLRPDEIQSAFTVFNFVENQFSPVEPPSRYATFASECVLRNNLDRLRRHHALVENLGLGQDRKAWSSLVAAAEISMVTLRPDELIDAARSLVTVAVDAAQAKFALELLLPHAIRLADASNTVGLEAIAEHIASLVTRAGNTAESAQTAPVGSLRTQAGKTLDAGRAKTTAALLKACGPARRTVLVSLLTDTVASPEAKFTVLADCSEREALLDLLIEGIPLVGSPALEAALLLPAFRAAQEAHLSLHLWERMSATVTRTLVAPWDEPKIRLAQQLTDCMSVQDCADGFVALRFKSLEAKRPEDSNLILELEEIARACPLCREPKQIAMQSLQFARKIFPGSAPSGADIEAMARMAEAVADPACHEVFRSSYAANLNLAPISEQARIRRRLAGSGVVSVLSRELLDELLRRNESAPTQIGSDWTDLLKAYPRVLTKLCLDMAVLLKPASENSLLPVAEELIKKFKPHFSPEGAEALFNAVVTALPLKPLTSSWEMHLGSLERDRVGVGFSRLCVIRFMGRVKGRQKQQSDWCIEQFPARDDEWENHLPKLNVPEKKQAVDWALELFREVGIRSPAQAEYLTTVLAPAKQDSPEDIASAIHRLVVDRDAVTLVVTATHVADCALKLTKGASIWRDIFQELTKTFSNQVLELLADHLALRQGNRREDYLEQVDKLCEAANLPKGRAALAISRRTQGGETTSEKGKNRTGFFTKAKDLFGGLLGHSTEPSHADPKKD